MSMVENDIRFVCFDFDGVFTDCKFYITSKGEHFKCYNGKDSYAIKILKDKGIKTGLITAHDSDIIPHLLTFNHFNKLDYVKRGTRNKTNILDTWRKQLNLEWNQIAYIGDDTADIKCLEAVGYSACPQDAIQDVKDICTFVCSKVGGNGAVREFVEHLLKGRD